MASIREGVWSHDGPGGSSPHLGGSCPRNLWSTRSVLPPQLRKCCPLRRARRQPGGRPDFEFLDASIQRTLERRVSPHEASAIPPWRAANSEVQIYPDVHSIRTGIQRCRDARAARDISGPPLDPGPRAPPSFSVTQDDSDIPDTMASTFRSTVDSSKFGVVPA